MTILIIITFFAVYNVIILAEEQKRAVRAHVTESATEWPAYTLAEVAQRNTAANCWMAAFGNVYNLTDYIASESHPGGRSALLSGCGTDATATFERIHSPSARRDLDALQVGVLVDN